MFLEELTYWHWIALSAVPLLFHFFAPGTVFLWFAVATASTGIVAWALPSLSMGQQLAAFVVLVAVAMIMALLTRRSREQSIDNDLVEQRGTEYVGSIYTLENEVVGGYGQVCIGHTIWPVQMRDQGPDLPAGEFVKVVGVEGSSLLVMSAADSHWRQAR